MADTLEGSPSGPKLSLTPEEKQYYGRLFKEADPDGFQVVSGDVAVKFFEATKLPPGVLGQIWQIADTENRGLLTPSGFSVVLRLIGHAQAGRTPTNEIAFQSGPLPIFQGHAPPSQPLSAQNTGTQASPVAGPASIRVPPLTPDKLAEYSSEFRQSGVENGLLPGLVAKQLFERDALPNEVLGRIWNLSDMQGRGALDLTEFIIARHLLASYKAGVMRGVPTSLPPGLYEAAARKSSAQSKSRPSSGIQGPTAIPPQLSGYGRPQSPIARQQVATPLSIQSTGEIWLFDPNDKNRQALDSQFAKLDPTNNGYISGETAVRFFKNSKLSDDALEKVWDLADINMEGRLNKDEFAVAMYLIRQQRGSKDGKSHLPAVLPPTLVPPSMRRQMLPQPAPVASPVQARTAADDLFGLDAFTSTPAPTQVSQPTGGSAAGTFSDIRAPLAASSPAVSSSTFKPFVPSSSFGQTIMPQSTGSTAAPQSRSVQASHDLLGDADPEVSQKLTKETSDLGNLSNQVGQLSQQMTEVRGDRSKAEQEVSQTAQQKRELENRLAQFRAMYEREIKEVKALQESLATSRTETRRLQQEIAMIDGSYQDLRSQHQQVSSTLQADQQENAALKEKMRQVNAEIAEMRPRLEKLKSEARQQKGLVAINRKQLATNEAERDRVQGELTAAKQELEQARKELEQTSKDLEHTKASNAELDRKLKEAGGLKAEIEEARNSQSRSLQSPAPVASPALSTGSNPFFRQTMTGTADGLRSPPLPIQSESGEGDYTFDSIFGPSYLEPSAAPPPALFQNETSALRGSIVAHNNADPSKGMLSSFPATPNIPPPPASTQFTPSVLPFRGPLQREHSVTSSTAAMPPASRSSPAGTLGERTTSESTMSQKSQLGDSAKPVEDVTSDERSLQPGHVDQATPTGPTSAFESEPNPFDHPPTGKPDVVPGAFPDEASRSEAPHTGIPPATVAVGAGLTTLALGAGIAVAAVSQQNESHDENAKPPAEPAELEKSKANSDSDPFLQGPRASTSDTGKTSDFDSAFASINAVPGTNGNAKTSASEFPPIEEIDGDDSDSGSEEPMGFDDDFNAVSLSQPSQTGQSHQVRSREPQNTASDASGSLQIPRPAFDSTPSAGSVLPGIDTQTSPPTYGESVPNDNPSHFPPEFKGLLPSREDPTSAPPFTSAEASDPRPAKQAPPYGPETTSPHPAEPAATSASKAFPVDDFDSMFASMGAAPAPMEDDDEDDAEDEIFNGPHSPSHTNKVTEFDPTFDSPGQLSRSTTAKPQSSSFYSAATNGPGKQTSASSNYSQASYEGLSSFGTQRNTSQPTATNTSHDWNAMFAGLDTPAPAVANDIDTGFPHEPYPNPTASIYSTSEPTKAPSATSPAPAMPPQPSHTTSTSPERPRLARALTHGTEHDDPILKRLTSMGWSREECLAALEKYDYNIDKATDYLTFKT